MHKSKFLALLLAIAMVVSMVVVPVYAEGDLSEYTLTANKTTVAPGETVTVTLAVNAANLAAFDLSVNYGETMILTGSTSEREGLILSPEDKLTAPQKVILTTLTPLEGNVKLVTYNFTAPAEEGEYAITVTADELSNLNLDGDLIAPTYGEELVITVLKNACPEHAAKQDWTIVNAGTWTGGELAGGHYKLNGNQTLTAALTIAAETEVCIDLNGHTITTNAVYDSSSRAKSGDRVFVNNGVLTVLDSSAEASGVISNGSVRAAGNETAAGGNVLNNAGATFNLYGGTIDNGQAWATAYNTALAAGGNIYGDTGSTINIYGGTVSNGRIPFTSYSASTYGRFGGNIASYGTLNISGGTIIGGRIYFTDTSANNNRDQYYYGGNIAALDGSTLNITGGTITGGYLNAIRPQTDATATETTTGKAAGTTTVGGGNICIQNATSASIKNATVTDGSLLAQSSNVAAYSKTTNGTTTYSTGASAYAYGGNIYCVGTDLTIQASTITNGSITADASGVAGGAVVPAIATAIGGNIYFADANKNLTLEDVTVTGGSVIGKAVAGTDSTSTKAVTSNAQGGNIGVNRGSTVTIGGDSSISGGTVTGLDLKTSRGGNIYIYKGSKFVMKDNAQSTGGTLAVYGSETLNTTGSGANVYMEGVSNTARSVIEFHDNAVITNGTGGSKYSYGLKLDWYNDVYVYGGDISGIGINAKTVENGGDWIYLYAGKVTMGMTSYTAYVVPQECACSTLSDKVFSAWQTNLDASGYCATCDHTYANPIKGSHNYVEDAENAGHYACSTCGYVLTCSNPDHADATWTVFADRASRDLSGHYVMLADESYNSLQMQNTDADGDGAVDSVCIDMNGYALAQNQAGRRAFAMNGDTIFQGGGTIYNAVGGGAGAGAVMALSTGDIKLYGITIYGGVDSDSTGGNLSVSSGTVYMEDCTIKGGEANNGGNIVVSGGSLTMKDCTVSGGVANTDGGNIAITNASAVVSMENCKIVGGTAVQYGGNIALTKAATLNMNNCELIGGTADQRGGNLYSATNGAKIVIDGGVIADGVAGAEGTTNGRGGNLFIQRGWDNSSYNHLTVTGGTVIKNGTATKDGGNICAIYASLDLDNCEIFGGAASEGDNICTTSSGEGCTIIFGATTKVYDGTVVLAKSSTSEDYPATYTFESGAHVEDLVVASSNMVVNAAANVTYTGDVLPGVTSHFDGETETYVTKATLADAIAAVAGEGDKVILGKAETADVNVEGYTLDLNGQTLTGNVNAADAASLVIDSTEGAGLIVGDVNLFGANGGYLPVNTEAGYKLETVSLRQATQELDGDKLKLKIAFNDAADETFLDEVFANATTTPGAGDVQVVVTVTYAGGEVTAQYDYDLLNLYASAWGSKMFTCTITNNNDVAIESITASVCSNGVEIAAVDVTK